MGKRIKRLFMIKTRVEASFVIFALATGSLQRGEVYLHQYPGMGGWLLYGACTITVFMAGGKIFDAVRAGI